MKHAIETEWHIGKPLIILTLLGDVDHDETARSRINTLLSSFIQSSKFVQNEGEIRCPWIVANPLDQMGNEVGYIVRKLNEKCNTVKDKECNIPVRCIGMCTWGMVADRDQIKPGEVHFVIRKGKDIKTEKKIQSPLNAYMSHYLFVDDGTNGVRGFARYTQKLLAEYIEPRVCLVLGGGDGTLENLKRSLLDGVPCVIVAGSGGVADEMASMLSQTTALSAEVDVDTLLNLDEIPKKHRPLLKQCLEKRRNCYVWSPNCIDFEEIQGFILNVVSDYYSIPDEAEEVDLEKLLAYIKLCQLWDQPDLAKHALLRLDKLQKQNILIDSIKRGRHMMIRFLLENFPKDFNDMTLLHVKDILNSCPDTLQRMERFCKSEETGSLHMISSKLTKFMEDKNVDSNADHFLMNLDDTDDEDKELDQLDEVFRFIFIWSIFKFDYDTADVILAFLEHPMSSTLLGANILSSLGQVPKFEVQKVVFTDAAKKLEKKACQLLETCYRINKWKTIFLLLQDYGIGVSCLELTASNDHTHNFLVMPACQEFLTKIWENGMTHRQSRVPLAGIRWQSLNCCLISLLSLPACVSLPILISISEGPLEWWHKVLLVLASFGISAIFLILLSVGFAVRPKALGYFYARQDQDYTNHYITFQDDMGITKEADSNSLGQKLHEMGINPSHLHNSSKNKCWQSAAFVWQLNTSPLVKFLHYTMSYVTYLIFFACALTEEKHSTEEFVLLFLYWITFIVDEIKQFRDCENSKNKWGEYFSSSWNRLDTCINMLKIITMGVFIGHEIKEKRIGKHDIDGNIYALFALVFALDTIRMLQIFLIGSIFGPILLMVGQMIQDLRNILLITFVFILSYGITLLGVNYLVNPSLRGNGNGTRDNGTRDNGAHDNGTHYFNAPAMAVMKIVLKCPIYHLFGENFNDDEENYCWPEKGNSSNFTVAIFIPTLRGLYLLISVVLLLNLLIAMFNSSIGKVEQRSERLWYLHRRNIIFENWKRCSFPFAPYQLIQIILSWVCKCCESCKSKCSSQESQHFNCKMLSITPTSPEARSWLKKVNQWEKLVFHKTFPQLSLTETVNQRKQLNKEYQDQQEIMDSKLREARKISSNEMEKRFKRLEKNISTMIQRKFERNQPNKKGLVLQVKDSKNMGNFAAKPAAGTKRRSTISPTDAISNMFDE